MSYSCEYWWTFTALVPGSLSLSLSLPFSSQYIFPQLKIFFSSPVSPSDLFKKDPNLASLSLKSPEMNTFEEYFFLLLEITRSNLIPIWGWVVPKSYLSPNPKERITSRKKWYPFQMCCKNVEIKISQAMNLPNKCTTLVAQLVEMSLPKPEERGSNPAITNFNANTHIDLRL